MGLLLPFEWKKGEHLSIVGDTGSGKTLTASHLLSVRQYTITLRSKSDRIQFLQDHKKEVRTQRGMDVLKWNRIVLEPRIEQQYEVFSSVLNKVWQQGNWTVYIDELFALIRMGLEGPIDRLLTQGREFKVAGRIAHVSMVMAMQRPVDVTRYALGESHHIICFSLEGRDIQTIREVSGRKFADEVATLTGHEFAWFHRPTRNVWKGQLSDLLKEVA